MGIPIEIQKALNTLANQYASRFLTHARGVLSQRKYKATGATAKSLSVSVTPASSKDSPHIILRYQESADFIAAKKLIYTKQAPATAILDTVMADKFKIRYVPGYARGATPGISIKQQQQRIGYAIALSKFKDQKHKRKRWKKEALTDLLIKMNTALESKWAVAVEQLLAKSLTT